MAEGACYRMRPHHIPILSQLSFLRESEREGYIRSKINDYSLDYQKEDAERDHRLLGRPMEYSEQFTTKLVDFYRRVFEDGGASLKIVDGPDDICMLGCNRKIYSCGMESAKSIKNIEGYGMHIGDVLPVSMLIED